MSKPVEIAVISGKGGTGKTVLTSALAVLVPNKVTADCDVDAPDMHLLLQPKVEREEVFSGMKLASIDATRCTACGKCVEVCHFGAVKAEDIDGDTGYAIDPLGCEGCGVCVWMCPADAIEFEESAGGKWFVSDTRLGKFVHAQLEPAQENSGKLVTLVRREARRLAEEAGNETVVIDGPPGIGCPVIASIAGADFAVIVTEPTLSGIHDLERVLGLTDHFGLRAGVVINKYDLNGEISAEIEDYLSKRHTIYLGKIPFGEEVKDAIAAGRSVLEHSDGPVSNAVRVIVENIISLAPETRKTQDISKA
jgi:MinD superfamily P-loop ATPase